MMKWRDKGKDPRMPSVKWPGLTKLFAKFGYDIDTCSVDEANMLHDIIKKWKGLPKEEVRYCSVCGHMRDVFRNVYHIFECKECGAHIKGA